MQMMLAFSLEQSIVLVYLINYRFEQMFGAVLVYFARTSVFDFEDYVTSNYITNLLHLQNFLT